jgi:hypothetical protein
VDAIELQRIGVGPAAEQLCQAGEAGTAAPAKVERPVFPSEPRDVVGRERPRADGAHLTAEDVEELRQLVET